MSDRKIRSIQKKFKLKKARIQTYWEEFSNGHRTVHSLLHACVYVYDLITREDRATQNTENDADLPSQSASVKKVQCTVTSPTLAQARLDKLILNYIVHGMRPLSSVEDKSFIELVEGLQPKPTKNVMTRKTLGVRTDEAHRNMLQCVRDSLESTSYVCTTADIWSTNNKSYFWCNSPLVIR